MLLNFDFSNIKNNLEPKAGRILISEPLSNDSFFGRSIVFITEHNIDGSVGFILNKESNYNIDELLENININQPLYYGGPVGNNSIHFIHKYGDIIDDSIEFVDGVFWGGNFEQIKKYYEKGIIENKNIIFFIGYSGWSPNQLNDEIEDNSWLVADIERDVIFNKNQKGLWQEVVKNLKNDFSFWKNIPLNPNLN